ncbi:MAG: response regulator [Cyclobacteriaceae bacterium]
MLDSKEIAILYVDDEEVNLFLFKTNFEASYPVFTATSGEEGLHELETHDDKIIVVISDMKMPGMSGVEFIRKAREKHNNIVYFILTGYASNEEIENALEERVIHQWFSKPFDMDKIEEAIQEALLEMG